MSMQKLFEGLGRCDCGCETDAIVRAMSGKTAATAFADMNELATLGRAATDDKGKKAAQSVAYAAEQVFLLYAPAAPALAWEAAYPQFGGTLNPVLAFEGYYRCLNDPEKETRRCVRRELLKPDSVCATAPTGRTLLERLLLVGEPALRSSLTEALVEEGLVLGILPQDVALAHLKRMVEAERRRGVLNDIGWATLSGILQQKFGKLVPVDAGARGLAVVEGPFGGQVVVFNGKPLDVYVGVGQTFHDDARAAWVTRETIDRSTLDGDQWRLRIWGYKDGDKKPHELFERHAYSGREGSGRLTDLALAPEGVTGRYVFTGVPACGIMAGTQDADEPLVLPL